MLWSTENVAAPVKSRENEAGSGFEMGEMFFINTHIQS